SGVFARETWDGGYILAGSTGASIPGEGDILLAKTNSLGRVEWEQRFSYKEGRRDTALGLHLFPARGAGKIDDPMDAGAVLHSITRRAAEFARSRTERQRRRALDPRDFNALRDAGFHRFALPAEHSGLWRDVRSSARPLCRSLRALARGDSSVALVASMHPA